MKKTLKKRLALGHDTLRVLTDLPETKPRYGTNENVFPNSSTDPQQTCPSSSTNQCNCQ